MLSKASFLPGFHDVVPHVMILVFSVVNALFCLYQHADSIATTVIISVFDSNQYHHHSKPHSFSVLQNVLIPDHKEKQFSYDGIFTDLLPNR